MLSASLGSPPLIAFPCFSVFWDLYCAAPERRDQCDHSSEAKAFHDYGFVSSGYGVNGIGHNAGPAPSPLGQMPPNEGMGPGGPMGSNFFPVREGEEGFRFTTFSSSSPSYFPPLQPFMGAPRYPSGPRPGGVRMPQGMGSEFNGVS